MAIMPKQIVNDVVAILTQAKQGKGTQPCFLSSFQILERLPTATRDQIILERGMAGSGTGSHYAAATLVAQACEMVPGRDETYVDTKGMTFEVAGKSINPGYEICKFYRLP